MASRERALADYVTVVRAHRLATTAFIVADSGDCLGIQREEVARVRGRRLRAIMSADLAGLRLGDSWMLAVVLCPGDTTERLATWAADQRSEDLPRVRFYEHPSVKPKVTYRAWVEAGLPMPLRDTVRDFASFHRRFGNDLNNRIYLDWRPKA